MTRLVGRISHLSVKVAILQKKAGEMGGTQPAGFTSTQYAC
jgi:hypothetical protein